MTIPQVLKSLIFLGLLFFAHWALGATHFLFDSQGNAQYFLDDFSTMVPVLRVRGELVSSGDLLVLESGEQIPFQKIIGFGNHTIVVQSNSNTASRIPKNFEPQTLEVFHGYRVTYNKLLEGIDKIFLANFLSVEVQSQYIHIVEKLQIDQLLDSFIFFGEGRESQKYKDLIEFLWAFRDVVDENDMSFQQVGYVQDRGWVLFDYGTKVHMTTDHNSSVLDSDLVRQIRGLPSQDYPLRDMILEDLLEREEERAIQRACLRVAS